ncbi:hypothetical protein AMK23_11010 [Streptomyces sp. CB02130]|uniref:hypothetical protein n=1 Tax=Streptomyces sp. CB02130 TaxID=1703934 RepID=UPI00093E2973|nr:hypothetical protein [Streptomyces sp. CB02130]OKJ28876.1 hypothetical protein AMK23_11010 [Streptomyces sp. CB02130]
MGLFSRKSNDTPSNPAMTELGREFAIARRHGDRKTMRRIGREYDAHATGETDAASFQRGQESYDALPPIKTPRRNRRR